MYDFFNFTLFKRNFASQVMFQYHEQAQNTKGSTKYKPENRLRPACAWFQTPLWEFTALSGPVYSCFMESPHSPPTSLFCLRVWR